MAATQERSVLPGDVVRSLKKRSFSLRAFLAELIGMTFFVFAGCGTAVFFSSTRVSEFAVSTEQGQLGVTAGGGTDAAASTGQLAGLIKTGFIDSVGTSMGRLDGVMEQGAFQRPGCKHSNPSPQQPVPTAGGPTTPLAPRHLQAAVLTVNSSWGVLTAMAFGMSIMVLAYGIGHVSGCHLNMAVTISLMLSGNCGIIQAVANICAQLIGSLLAAGLLYGVIPNGGASSLGSNIGASSAACCSALLMAVLSARRSGGVAALVHPHSATGAAPACSVGL